LAAIAPPRTRWPPLRPTYHLKTSTEPSTRALTVSVDVCEPPPIRGYSGPVAFDQWGIVHTPTWTVPPPQGLADGEIRLRMPSIADAPLLPHRYAGAEGGLDGVCVPLADEATLEVCEALIRDRLAGWRSRPSVRGRALVIDEASGSNAIGYIGLRDCGECVEVAYGIAPEYRGRGYASRAVRLAAECLIEAGIAREVELRIGKEHVESQRVAQRAGFELIGRVVSQVSGTEDTYDDLRFVRTVLLGGLKGENSTQGGGR
jgi:RimJ/RimL family protein N-acetyltransferase